MRQARPVVVASRSKEDLRLVLESPKRLAMNDAVSITLKGRSNVVFKLGAQPPFRLGGFGGLWREELAFAILQILSDFPHH